MGVSSKISNHDIARSERIRNGKELSKSGDPSRLWSFPGNVEPFFFLSDSQHDHQHEPTARQSSTVRQTRAMAKWRDGARSASG